MSGGREATPGEITIDVVLTPQQIAAAFAGLSDDDQAQVFIEVARLAAEWPPGNLDQWYAVGRHLATCKCSTDEARVLVQRIADGARACEVIA